MAHYSLFLPGVSGISPSHLRSVGLDDLQTRQGWSWSEVSNGPGGLDGMIAQFFSHREDANPVLGFNSDVQQWTPCGARPDLDFGKGAFWFGIEPQRPPEPFDLAHRRRIIGKDVRLKDNNLWHIPETLQLPLDMGRDPETGELTKLYSEEYEEFSKMAEKYVMTFFSNIIQLEEACVMNPDNDPGENHVEFPMEDSWEYCARALSINYRVAEPIIGPGMLHLYDDRRMSYIILASLAFPDIIEVIEKKKITSPVSIPVGLNTCSGELTRLDPQVGSTSISSSGSDTHV